MNTLFRMFLLVGLFPFFTLASQAGNGCCTIAAPPPVSPILPTDFLGWTNTYRLQNDRAVAILIPTVGRLVHFSSLQGSSPFRIEPTLQGQIPPEGEPFFNMGGDWLWPVSQARWASFSSDGKDWPPPAILADLPWNGSAWTDAEGVPSALLTREYGAPLHILVSRLFRLEPGSTTLTVQQRIERTAPSDIPVVLWNISQIAQAEHIVLPVEKKSKFRGGLTALMGQKPSKKQLATCKGAAVYRVGPGSETKLGSDSPRGWIAAAKGTNLIFESVSNSTTGEYPDGGCIVEVYSNQGLGYSEIETLSPEVLLAPGTVLENTLRIELSTTETPLTACSLADFIHTLAQKVK